MKKNNENGHLKICGNEDYIENILAENLTLKRKLDSKCEAIAILNKEVDKLKYEKDRLKILIEDIKQRPVSTSSEPEVYHPDSSKNLRLEVDTLRQKLRDALGDVQALRCQQLNGKVIQQPVEEDRNLLKEEKLIEQIENLQRSKQQLEADFHAVLDEKEELVTERDAYKCKLHRLNHECNVLLNGKNNGIIDLDALVMENRLLQERLLHAQEKCQLEAQVSARYKSMLQTKKEKGGSNGDSSGGQLLSKKQVKELLDTYGTTEIPGPEASLPELRSLCLALLDSLGDKSLALTHQKRANRILAARIAELQARLETQHTRQAVESPSTALLEGYKPIALSPRMEDRDDIKSNNT